MRNYLIISKDLGYIKNQAFHQLMEDVNGINEELNTLIKTLRIRNQQKPESKSNSESKR